jgi:DNA polymerase beta
MSDVKQTIIDALDVMRRRDVAEKKTFQARAYSKVIEQIKGKVAVRSWDDLDGVTGIGEKIREKIQEILDTGSLASAEKAKEVYSLKLYDELLACYGIGPAKAKELVEEHNVKGIADLRKKVEKNPKLLNDKQKIGLQYYEDILLRIPRAEMDDHRGTLEFIMDDNTIFEVVGSYRRRAESSGDIDVLICSEDPSVLNELIRRLVVCEYIKEILAQGDKKCLAICQLKGCPARRLDILLTPPEEYPYAILYFTGCDTFNVAFRQRALARGYTLNEHTMKSLGEAPEPPTMTCERDIFRHLGLCYVEPWDRKGPGDVKPMKKLVLVTK